jgi:RTX calcium-binding nonapeptide repeat (4 copies)
MREKLLRGVAGKLFVASLLAALLLLVAAMPAAAKGPKCFGKRATEVGTAGGEKIRGTAKNDSLIGKGGPDKILGRGGKDRICGGKGKDKINGDKGNDKLDGGKGNDKVNGGKGNDTANGGKGNDKVNGGKGNDLIDGGMGQDTANGGPGVDTCVNVEVVQDCENQHPALHFDDQIDFGFFQDVTEHNVVAGDTVTTPIRIGNGIAGAAGYTASNVSPQGFLSGSSQILGFFEGGTADHDDANAVVNLPFPVQFFGVSYTQAVVSTNGFVAFGSPALDYFTDRNPPAGDVAEFYRGAFPYWGDLDLFQGGDTVTDTTPGVVSVVSAPDAIAIQWKDVGFHATATPVRSFQVAFFKDGRIRFDYPGSNDPASDNALVALSGGTGLGSYAEIARNTLVVPGSSILFTPNALGPSGAAPTGTATATIPPGATFQPGATDPRCSLTTVPTAGSPGAVSCATPVLNPGAGDAFNVSWVVPPLPATLNLTATYAADGFSLTDAEQTFPP